MERKRLITLTEIAVMAGVGAILSVFVALRLWPQGGSVSLAMVPIVLAGLLRFLSHFVSGVVWFGSYAPKEFSPVLWSVLYNLSYIIPDILVSILVVSLLAAKAPRLVQTG